MSEELICIAVTLAWKSETKKSQNGKGLASNAKQFITRKFVAWIQVWTGWWVEVLTNGLGKPI